MDRFLAHRTALVTGATSGIGLAIARALGAAGARVIINGLGDPDAIEAARAAVLEAGAPDVRHDGADLRDPAAIAAMMSAAGPVDVLVNCAGVQHTASMADMPAERWDLIIAVNLSAAFHTIHAALPGMIERGFGRVVNIASVHGLVASVNKAPYVASKFGLVGFTQAVMLDLRKYGVKTTTIMPGSVATHFGGNVPADKDAWKIQPEDIGDMVVYLLKVPERTLPSKVEVRPTIPGA